MPLMSIIGCMEYEKEIARILAEDKTIEHIIVVDDSSSSELVSDLKHMGVKPRLLYPETIPPGLKKSKGFNVLVTLQDDNVYKSPQHLKNETCEKIKFYGPVSNGVLMYSTSCGRLLQKEGIDFHNRKFALELLSEDDTNTAYLKEELDESLSSSAKKRESRIEADSQKLEEMHKVYYNRLKATILSPKANS
ncbi:hypothetical protein RE474_11015 [Methanolobus sediminis]|uniref:Uncharacterized protein n=1 Tax=Methanolobus sediminis TaxID=3072978 RepID=A0AA51UJB3_9EURY|nr:hypothetical protein [Methanolobus sediminis]WMW24606.1 hypothetical protein RE474_11015 [Methanolobus sediminis]